MILFSLTVNIDKDIEAEWLDWMKQSFIPSLWLTGFFEEKRFLKLLNEESEVEGMTYSLQLTLSDIDKMKDFESNYLNDFRHLLYGKFSGKVVDFFTILEKVDIC